MSAIIETPVKSEPSPAAPAAPPPPRTPSSNLPSGVKVDHQHDASAFFKKDEPVAPKPDSAPGAAGVPTPPPPPPAPKDSDPAPVAVPKDDLGSQLTDQFLPEGAKKPVVPAVEPSAPAAYDNPEDKIVLDPKYSAPAHESFKAIKGVVKEVRSQVAARDSEITALKAELERAKSGAVVVESPEIVKMKEEHAQMSKRLMVVDLENHPNFQREFVAPRNAAEQEARNILEAAGVSGVDINGILSKDPVAFRKELSAIAAKLPTGLDQADFANAMRTAHTLRQKAGEAVAKAGEINQVLRTQQVQMHKTAFEDTFNGTIGSLRLAELKAPAGATAEQVAEVTAFNEGIRGIRAQAERIALGTTDPKSIAGAAIKAAAYEFQVNRVMPMMGKVIAQKNAEIAELRAKLDGIRARNPNRDIGGMPSGSNGVDPSKMSHHEAAEYYANLGKGGG